MIEMDVWFEAVRIVANQKMFFDLESEMWKEKFKKDVQLMYDLLIDVFPTSQ